MTMLPTSQVDESGSRSQRQEARVSVELFKNRWVRFGLLSTGLIALFSLVRIITDEPKLTAGNTFILAFAGWAGWQYGPWYALVFGAFGGALGGLIHAVATVTFGVDQIVSGIAITIIAPGITRFLSSQVFVGNADGTITQSPSISGSVFASPIHSGSLLMPWLVSRDPAGFAIRSA